MKEKINQGLGVFAPMFLLMLVTGLTGAWLNQRGIQVRLIGWDTYLLALIAFGALIIQQDAGLPQVTGKSISFRIRFLVPFVVGMFFGVADIDVLEVLVPHAPYKDLPLFLQPFPYSGLLFGSCALYVEILHRLIPFTIVMFLANKLIPRYSLHVFWITATLTSVWEPLEQMLEGPEWLAIYGFMSGFAMNYVQAMVYKRSGWLSAVFVRFGHYILWHILLGIYVQYFIL